MTIENGKGLYMKYLWMAVLAISLMGCQGTGEKKMALENKKDKVSYGIGVNIGTSLKKDSIAIEPDILMRGIKDALNDSAKRLMTELEVQQTMNAFQQEMRAKQAESAKAVAEKNMLEGEAFLAGNKKKQGVVTLPSGLQYTVITEGTGKMPRANQTVTTHYRGTLIDGTEFDNSYKRGEPATFPVTGVIPGWTEALQHMRVGSKWKLFIPSNLAYGERSAGNIISPNSTLIFEIELLAIQ